jgi:hypothetical protein
MPRRKVKLNVKVRIMRESLRLTGVEDVLRKYGVSERSAYHWYRKVLEALPDILAEEKPGRKSKSQPDSAPPFEG